jgi:1-acyl-sn-glycerol-3-phosphate acyltransferase
MGWLCRARAALALGAVLILALAWCCAGRRRARAVAVLAWRVLMAGFGVRLRCHGSIPKDAARCLIVANHVSWIDIAVLGRVIDAGFVAKDDVARWPLIGGLARRYGCLFVSRSSRADLSAHAARVEGWPAGQGLILFPEGTTSDGRALLPFRSSLFPQPGERWAGVLPLAISFRRHDGTALCPAQRRAVAWLDDDALLPHAFALAARGGVLVDLWFEPVVAAGNRKRAAALSRSAIASRLSAIAAADQAATLKRAA